jgi:uncharacterized membrane protein YfcA
MSFPAATAAGGVAGFVLGFLGAGGTVVGLPFLLLSADASAHRAMGTNALGVALIAGALCLWRVRRGEVRLPAGLWFTIPGLAGILVGVRLGLAVAGQRLVFLLGFVLFAVAGWMAYLSTRALSPSNGREAEPVGPLAAGRATALAATAVLVGATAGFFAIGGGFMIVPGLMLAGGLDLGAAAATALLPIAAFALLVGLAYLRAGAVDVPAAALMLGVGMLGGVTGVWLAQRLSRRVMQRVFAAALVAIGAYLTLR